MKNIKKRKEKRIEEKKGKIHPLELEYIYLNFYLTVLFCLNKIDEIYVT